MCHPKLVRHNRLHGFSLRITEYHKQRRLRLLTSIIHTHTERSLHGGQVSTATEVRAEMNVSWDHVGESRLDSIVIDPLFKGTSEVMIGHDRESLYGYTGRCQGTDHGSLT